MVRKKSTGPFIKRAKQTRIKVPKEIKKKADEVFFLLDKFNVDDIERWKLQHQKLYEFYWEEYSYYAHQRTRKAESLKNSLLEVCKPFYFKDWYRCVDLRHVLTSLSSKGSRISLRGGRFNIGQIDMGAFPSFSALYLAENQETSVREKFQIKNESTIFESFDFGLTKKSSYGFVRVHGEIENVIDITNELNLKSFLKQIKRLVPTDEMIEKAKILGLNPPDSIRTMKQLKKSLTEWDWSSNPVVLDIPSNSQIFGLIAKSAGVQAIAYKSKFHTGMCLAIFPENFQNSSSFVEVSDPLNEATLNKLDNNTWSLLS